MDPMEVISLILSVNFIVIIRGVRCNFSRGQRLPTPTPPDHIVIHHRLLPRIDLEYFVNVFTLEPCEPL